MIWLLKPDHSKTTEFAPAMAEDTGILPGLPAVAGKPVHVGFDGGRLTSDAGILLLSAVEQRLRIAERLAACLEDPRDPDRVRHELADMIRYRALLIAAGYPDGNDCDALRSDPAFAGDTIEFVYFPLNGLISVVSTMEDGSCVEVGMCGNEGMSDVAVVLGDNISSHHRSVVQATGSALKLSAVALREELRRDGALRSILLRYVYFALAQATQSAACNRLHSLEQRCARWLLSNARPDRGRQLSDNP
jgi:hypothetical protein